MADYDPTPRAATNPIACVTSWLGGLFRGPQPTYQPAPTPAPTVARVRAIEVERAPAFASDGTLCDGPIAVLTLVVDDATTAATVLEALDHGAQLRVATVGACG